MLTPPASLWWSSLGSPVVPRAPLGGDLDVDVAIIGGGFTGLWTARELLERDPHLRVVVIEQNVCGFGASGRNGGWASALYPVSASDVVSRHGLEGYNALRRVLERAVIELGQCAAHDGIEAHFVRGGSLNVARSDVQMARLTRDLEEARSHGVDSADLEFLDADQTRERADIAGAKGATFTPHCARLHPARLVRGLSDQCELRGVRIVEGTTVTRISPARGSRRARAVTTRGTVRADVIVRATEGYSAGLSGSRRDIVPLYSLMIATDVLPTSFWDDVGLRRYETFADERHLIIYGQRTADNRIAFGGRGAPYHFGSSVEPRFDANERVFSLLEGTLHELFPSLDAPITHRWGGPLAMPRNHAPFVEVDHAAGLARAGGYTGDGVVLSFVAARALAEQILDRAADSELSRLPFVQVPPRRWETEPWRYLGINAGLALASHVDNVERRGGRAARAEGLLARLMS